MAKEAGIVKENSLQIIDSTRILGAAAVQDTYTLIKKAIQKLIKACAKKQSSANETIKELVLSLDYNQTDKEDIDWNDPEARKKLLNQLVDDARLILSNVGEKEQLSPEEQQAVDVLAAVTEQDIEPDDNGQVRIKQGVAKDRIISVENTDMRHGHKSSSGKFNGHKGQTMMDEASEVITNVGITPGNQSDGEAVDELLESTIVQPSELMGDTAYGTLKARDDMEKYQVNTIAPIPLGGKKGTLYGKQDFIIDMNQKSCTCPAGQTTTKTRIKNDIISAFIFDKRLCNYCPHREQCTKHGKGKIITIHPEEKRRQEIIQQNNTAEFKQKYRNRAKIERKIAHLIRRGLRKTRYISRAKSLIQISFTAAVVNIKRIFALAQGDICLLSKLQTAMCK